MRPAGGRVTMGRQHLIPLGEGVYTVSEVCRILQPTMTRRKVHYWLDTGLISSQPITSGRPGVPTLLSFRQVLEVRTVQRLRDELQVSLPKIRKAYTWILANLFDKRETLQFAKGPGGALIVRIPDGDEIVVPGGQGVLPSTADALTAEMKSTHDAWESRVLPIRGYPHLVSAAGVMAGAPTIQGTRIETALVATFAESDGTYDAATIDTVHSTYPRLAPDAIEDALQFEGVHRRPA